MTVGTLKKMLEDAPDNASVHLQIGTRPNDHFAFATGVIVGTTPTNTKEVWIVAV